jgi:hypothetical protein
MASWSAKPNLARIPLKRIIKPHCYIRRLRRNASGTKPSSGDYLSYRGFFANRAGRGRDQQLPVTEIRLIRLRVEKTIPTDFMRVNSKLLVGD